MSRDQEEWPTFGVALGRRIRAVRAGQGLTAAEVADRSRDLGLGWDRSAVSRIESGERAVSVVELFVLGMITRTPVVDLLPDAPCMLTAGVAAHEGALRENAIKNTASLDPVGLRTALADAERRVAAADERVIVAERREAAARSEAVVKAAQRLEVEPWFVAVASERLWGRTLDAERDERTGVVLGESVRARQARRGHITRALVDELRPVLPGLLDDFRSAFPESDA